MWRSITFSFRNIIRNPGLSLMTGLFIFLASLMLGALSLVARGIDEAITKVEQGVILTLVLQPRATENEISQLLSELNATPGIASATYQSPAEVRELLKSSTDPSLSAALDILPDNPLTGQIVVQASNISAYEQWLSKLSDGAWSGVISNRNIADYQRVIEVLREQISQPIEWIIAMMSFILATITALLTYNTVRMVIYTQREEIGIMKLVGATDWFIRAPFLYQITWIVFFGSIPSAALLYVGAVIADAPLMSLLPQFSLAQIVIGDFVYTYITIVAGLLFVSLIGTFFSLRRWLKA